jgi:hypothetical protein
MVETSPDWRLQSDGQCRADASRYTKMCGRPAVAALRRPHGRTGYAWWAYCERHLYGRWLEDGQLWRWAMRPIKDDGEDTP